MLLPFKRMMKALQPPDSHHIDAAPGWLDLGNHIEADAELDNIAASSRAHPDVLNVRWGMRAGVQITTWFLRSRLTSQARNSEVVGDRQQPHDNYEMSQMQFRSL